MPGLSAIEREYEASDQRRYFVPCPHCDHRQWLRFEQLRWEKGQPDTAAYVCESCETPIAEHHKTGMLEHGEWRAMAPENGSRTAGFHLSSLYSPVGWRSWRDIAAAWESAVSQESGSAAAIKTFKNTELGETWVEEGEAPDWQRLLERREDYPIGTVPQGGLLLVGGADVQKDRIEASIWAFGRGKESLADGAPGADGRHRPRCGLEALWAKCLRRPGRMHRVHRCHWPGLRWIPALPPRRPMPSSAQCHDPRVMAVKGVARGAALIGTPTAVDVSAGGKRLRRGIKVFSVAVGIAKLEFYNNLRKAAEVGADGSTALSGRLRPSAQDRWRVLQQLCAEQLVTRRDRNGFAHARVAEDARAERGLGLLTSTPGGRSRAPGSTASRNAIGANWNDNWGLAATPDDTAAT